VVRTPAQMSRGHAGKGRAEAQKALGLRALRRTMWAEVLPCRSPLKTRLRSPLKSPCEPMSHPTPARPAAGRRPRRTPHAGPPEGRHPTSLPLKRLAWLLNLTKIWQLPAVRAVLMEASWITNFCGSGAGKKRKRRVFVLRAGSESLTFTVSGDHKEKFIAYSVSYRHGSPIRIGHDTCPVPCPALGGPWPWRARALGRGPRRALGSGSRALALSGGSGSSSGSSRWRVLWRWACVSGDGDGSRAVARLQQAQASSSQAPAAHLQARDGAPGHAAPTLALAFARCLHLLVRPVRCVLSLSRVYSSSSSSSVNMKSKSQ
jgi:hypothetical protein